MEDTADGWMQNVWMQNVDDAECVDAEGTDASRDNGYVALPKA